MTYMQLITHSAKWLATYASNGHETVTLFCLYEDSLSSPLNGRAMGIGSVQLLVFCGLPFGPLRS